MRSETFALGIRTVSGNIRIERLGGRCIAISMKKSTWNKKLYQINTHGEYFYIYDDAWDPPSVCHSWHTKIHLWFLSFHSDESPVCMQITHKKSSAWILWTSYPLNHFPSLCKAWSTFVDIFHEFKGKWLYHHAVQMIDAR